MKKLLSIIFALLLLCSCSENQPVEEPVTEPQIEIVDEVSYTDESGKFGFHKEGVPVTEAIYDKIIPAEKINGNNIYIGFNESPEGNGIYAGVITDGTRKAVSFDWEQGNYYVDEPNDLYWFYESENETLINETPLGNFCFIPPEEMGNSTPFYVIKGTFEGDSYTYLKNREGIWELYEKQSGGADSVYMDFCTTKYYWRYMDVRTGIEDLEGNSIVEPIYFFGDINVNRKFIIYDGYSKISVDVAKTYIMDWDGNIINDEYDYITLGVPEIGKFVLVANGWDEDGTYGWWFIDDYGNKLSEKYDMIVLTSVLYNHDYYDRTALVTKDGVETEISVLDYACDYE